MSDRLRFLQALEEAGLKGLHSHDVRRRAISGHPSERAKELEAQGYPIRRVRENKGRRPGVRFYLDQEPTTGVGAGGSERPDIRSRCVSSVDPGGGSGAIPPSSEPARLFPEPQVPSAYDPWSEAA